MASVANTSTAPQIWVRIPLLEYGDTYKKLSVWHQEPTQENNENHAVAKDINFTSFAHNIQENKLFLHSIVRYRTLAQNGKQSKKLKQQQKSKEQQQQQ